MSQRLQLYLTNEEYDFLLAATEYLGVTKAYVLRLCLRKPLGLGVGGSGETDYALLAEIRKVYASKLDTQGIM